MSLESRYWSGHEITAAIKRWVRENRELPTKKSWNVSGEYWPSCAIVVRRFGSWNEAISAAGYNPRQSSRPGVETGKPVVLNSVYIPFSLQQAFDDKCESLGVSKRTGARIAIQQWVEGSVEMVA